MNPIQLQTPDGTPAQVFMCGQCKAMYNEREAYSSLRCCLCPDCGVVHGDRRVGQCHECWTKWSHQRDCERLVAAEEVKDYTGPIWTGGDKYYSSPSDCLDYEGDEAPEWAHCCTVHSYTLDLDDAIQNMVENASVEERPDFDGIQELRDAVDKWNDLNKSVTYWQDDGKRKVRVREPKPC